MMKRSVAWILTLALALSCAFMCPATSAFAAEGNASFLLQEVKEEGGNYRTAPKSLCAVGDTLYTLTADGKVYAYRAGDAEASLYIDGLTTGYTQTIDSQKNISGIFNNGGALYCFFENTGVICALSADAEGKPVYGESVTLDLGDDFWVSYGDNEDQRYMAVQFSGSAVMDGKLYVSGYNYDIGQEEPVLYGFDLKTGAKTKYESGVIRSICPYKDGKLLCLATGNSVEMYDEEKNEYKPWSVSVFDPANDTLTPMCTVPKINYYNTLGFDYDAAADILYFATPNKIYRIVSFGAPELCAYTPVTDMYVENMLSTKLGLFAGRYFTADDNGVYLRTVDPALLPAETLSIYGSYSSNQHLRAAAQMDDIPIFFFDEAYYSSAQELGQALAGGESQIDLLSMTMSYMDFERLMQKGYCYDLSGEKELADFVNDLYPFIQDAVQYNGKLFALPVEINGYGFGYSAKAFAELGLTPPSSYLELIDFTNAWAKPENEEAQQSFAISTDEGEYRSKYFYNIMEAYEKYALADGGQFSLDTPAFRELMQALDALDTESIEVTGGWDDSGEPNEELEALWNKNQLMNDYTTYSVEDNNAGGDDYYTMTAQPLTLTGEEEVIVPMNLRVFFINPRSKNINAALRYLRAYTAAISQTDLANMSPNHNEQIENIYYQRNLEEMKKSMELQKELLDKAGEADKQALQESYDSYLEYVEKYKATERYSATEQSIAAYRKLMEHAVISRPSVIWSNNGDDSFYTLRERYLAKQISLEQFIQEGGGKLRLMQMENQ